MDVAVNLPGLRGMAADVDIEAGEPLVSLPVGAALLVTPKQRCPFPGFCSPAFYSAKPWHGLPLSITICTEAWQLMPELWSVP